MIRRIQYSHCFTFLEKVDLLSLCNVTFLCPQIPFALKPVSSDSDISTLTFLLSIFLAYLVSLFYALCILMLHIDPFDN